MLNAFMTGGNVALFTSSNTLVSPSAYHARAFNIGMRGMVRPAARRGSSRMETLPPEANLKEEGARARTTPRKLNCLVRKIEEDLYG